MNSRPLAILTFPPFVAVAGGRGFLSMLFFSPVPTCTTTCNTCNQ